MERLRESDLSSSRIPLLFGNILKKCLENRPGDVFPPILKWGSLLRPGRGGKFRLKLTPEGVAEAGKSLGQEHNLRSIIFLNFSSVCLLIFPPTFQTSSSGSQSRLLLFLIWFYDKGYINKIKYVVQTVERFGHFCPIFWE